MEEPTSLGDKLRASLADPDLSERGLSRLAVLVLSLAAAKAVFRLILFILVAGGATLWYHTRQDADSGLTDDARDISARAEEARAMAEETRRIVDEAHEKAETAQRDSRLRQKEAAVQNAVQTTVLALIGYSTDRGILTDNIDDLSDYGWRRNPDLIYDLQLLRDKNGDPSFLVTVRHRDPGLRAFKYDPDSGRGVEPAEPEPSVPAPSAGEAGGLEAGYASASHQKKQGLEDKEFAVKNALQQVALAQLAYKSERGDFTSNYDDLSLYYPWRRDSDLVYGELLVGQALNGEPNYKVIIRHKDKGPRAFKYDFADGRNFEPVD